MPADLLTRGFAATDAELFGGGVVRPPRYRVYLRNPQYEVVDELDNWLSLDFVDRANGIGTWSLEIANDTRTPSAVELQKAWGIVVTQDGVTKFSGSVTRFSKTFRTISVSGESDMALLRALALPDPLTSPPYPDAYDVITAQASAVMLNLVNNNIGPAARADRRVAALTLAADPHVGSTITARAGFQPLISLLSELAITPLATGLVFSILQSDTVPNTLEFKVRAPVDRSADALFSVEAGTAADYEDTQEAPAANAPFVLLGDGLAGTRTILEDTDAFSIAEWARRWETIIDRRDVTDTGEGEQALAEALAQTTTSRRVTITPLDVPSLQWGREYELGDLATFAAGGQTFVDLIREVHFSWDAERGPVVTPMLGQTGATNDDQLSTMVATIQGRLTNVERNWRVPDDSITLAMMTVDSVDTNQLLDDAVTPPKVDTLADPSADHQVLGYDATSGRFVWLSGSDIAGNGDFDDLTVTGDTVLGDNAALDTLAINAIMSANGAATFNAAAAFKNSVTIEDASNVVTAFFDAGNHRLLVGSATALSGASDDAFSVIGHVAYFAGPSGPAIGIRYGPSETVGWTVGVAGAGLHQDLLFRDDGGAETFRVGSSASTYQAQVTGDFHVTDDASVAGDLSSDRLAVGATGFSGAETLRSHGDVLISTGDLALSDGLIDVQGGTAGQIRVGTVLVNRASPSGAEKLRVNGISLLENLVQLAGTGTVFSLIGSSQTQSTVGAAGGASGLPATPRWYLKIDVGGSSGVIPVYNA